MIPDRMPAFLESSQRPTELKNYLQPSFNYGKNARSAKKIKERKWILKNQLRPGRLIELRTLATQPKTMLLTASFMRKLRHPRIGVTERLSEWRVGV